MRVSKGLHPRARPELEALAPYEPPDPRAGSLIYLDANESPLGPFPAAREALARELGNLNRYPRRDRELIEALAARHGVEPSRVALGNGIDGLIGYLADAYLEPGAEMVAPWPSFPTYVSEARKRGAAVKLVALRDGACDLDALLEAVGPRTRLLWVCNPNNPTGGAVARAALRRFAEAVPEHVLVLIDEAYFEYGGGPDQADAVRELVPSLPNVAALRTFSKIYALAALRVGYLIGPAAVVEALGKARLYYDVTEPANIAALASLDDDGELARRRLENERGRGLLAAGLRDLGLEVMPSEANFVAVNVGDADAVARFLLARGIATRSLSGVGAPEWLRIAVGTPDTIEQLLALAPEAFGAAGAIEARA